MSIGYDQLSKNAFQLLGSPFFEATGDVAVQDIAKPHHVVTQSNSPTWTQLASGIWVLDFNAAIPEYLQISAAASADLNFIAQSFSIVWWMNADSIANSPVLFCKGAGSIAGYYVQVLSTGEFIIVTNQGAAFQSTSSAAGAVTISTWNCWGISRSGTSIRLFKNGIDVSSVIGSHINPVTSAAYIFYILIFNGGAVNSLDGKLWNPRVWSGVALSEYEHRFIFERERIWFGV